jgi:hypothetical protein
MDDVEKRVLWQDNVKVLDELDIERASIFKSVLLNARANADVYCRLSDPNSTSVGLTLVQGEMEALASVCEQFSVEIQETNRDDQVRLVI